MNQIIGLLAGHELKGGSDYDMWCTCGWGNWPDLPDDVSEYPADYWDSPEEHIVKAFLSSIGITYEG